MILKCDCAAGDAYVTKTLTLPSDFWAQLDVMVPAATIAAIINFSALFVAFPDPPAGWGDDGLFLGDGTFAGLDVSSDVQTTGSPSIVENVFSQDAFHTVKFHVNGTTISWWLDGALLFTYTGGWSPGDLSGSQTFDFGAIFSNAAPGEIYYIDDVRVGTTDGGTDIYANSFESGTLAGWDTTVGGVSVVPDIGGGGPATVAVTPARDKAGATVTITGSGFTASDTIAATFNGSPLSVGTTTTNSGGSFAGSFTVPSLPAGHYTITVTDSHGVTASVSFTIARARDILDTASSALKGSNLSVNAITVLPAVDFGVGDIIIHQGVPHVTWIESSDNGIGLAPHYWYGPYVAKWNGSDWTLLTPDGALPDAVDPTGDISSWEKLDGEGVSATNNVCVQRRFPKLASDGENLYLSVIGIAMQRIQTNPGHTPPIYHYSQRSLQYGFVLDGSAWTPISDPIWGVFPLTIAHDGPYTTGTESSPYDFMDADISASPGHPGNVYFAFSDHGDLETAVPSTFAHLSIVGTDLAETSLAVDQNYSLSLAGGGDSLTLYYTGAGAFGPPGGGPDLTVWTPRGTSPINATTDLGFDFTGYTDIVLEPPITLEQDGHRYCAFAVFATHLGTALLINLILKGDPLAPTILAPLDPRTPAGGLPLEVATFGTSEFLPITFADDGDDWWLSTLVSAGGSDGVGEMFQLDKVCLSGTPVWNQYTLEPAATWSSGRTVVFDDAIWWFNAQDFFSSSPVGPMVYATPICRGCGDVCPGGGAHAQGRI